jgi:deoxyribodipyrimidine photo-lyase
MRATLISFITNTCMQDRRQPGHILARLFTDYEPGIHYPQLQMQSGTVGINQYRIYNLTKQQIDKDPDGHFVDKWVPELRSLPMPLKATPRKIE